MSTIGLGGRHADSQGQSSSLETVEGRKFDNALFSALDALEQGSVSYALIGGIAASGLGRPRSTQDIDVFIRPEDAEAVLELMARHGFRTERVNPTWLYKAFKEDVLVDIIFRSQGEFYFDDEMRSRAITVNYHGRRVRLVSPEDLILIKCAVHSEEGPHHWHDALSVLSQAKVDWDYLLHRARKAPRRLLALLIYAQSNDIWVPNQPVQQLFHLLYGDMKTSFRAFDMQGAETRVPNKPVATPEKAHHGHDAYLAGNIRDALASEASHGATAVEIWVESPHIMARGECQTMGQRQAVLEVIRRLAPAHTIDDQLRVADWTGPKDVKDIV